MKLHHHSEGPSEVFDEATALHIVIIYLIQYSH